MSDTLPRLDAKCCSKLACARALWNVSIKKHFWKKNNFKKSRYTNGHFLGNTYIYIYFFLKKHGKTHPESPVDGIVIHEFRKLSALLFSCHGVDFMLHLTPQATSVAVWGRCLEKKKQKKCTYWSDMILWNFMIFYNIFSERKPPVSLASSGQPELEGGCWREVPRSAWHSHAILSEFLFLNVFLNANCARGLRMLRIATEFMFCMTKPHAGSSAAEPCIHVAVITRCKHALFNDTAQKQWIGLTKNMTNIKGTPLNPTESIEHRTKESQKWNVA